MEATAIINHQREIMEAQLAVILERESKILDLTRCNKVMCEGLLLEVNDPGTVDPDLVLDAARDWADELARLEEFVLD